VEAEASACGLYKGAVGEGSPTPPEPSLSRLLLPKPSFTLSLRLLADYLRSSFVLSSYLEVASAASPPPCRATIFGPYSCLLGVRASGWSGRFEEFMVAVAKT
jgi:hypothetical protein